MRIDSIKKYLIPNIPYLFIGWACLKLGTAYRLAEGADLPHKLMGLGQTVGPAFADFAPGLDPLDWLIGICRLPRYLTKPRQRRSEWDMAGSDGISRVSTVFRGKSLLTNKMRII